MPQPENSYVALQIYVPPTTSEDDFEFGRAVDTALDQIVDAFVSAGWDKTLVQAQIQLLIDRPKK